MPAKNYFKQCLEVLKRLHKKHPSFSIGRHFSTALEEYGDTWSLTDKEMFFALEKYEAEMEFNSSNTTHERYVEKIIEDGINLDTILDDEEDDENY